MKKLTQLALVSLCIFLAASCQKTAIEEAQESESSEIKTITFKISQVEQIPFATNDYGTRASDLSSVCSHIFFAAYTTAGERVTYKSQTSSDKDFGKISVTLKEGTYRIAILAYNSKDNPSSSTSPDKITFGNNGKMSDTFLWSEEVTVSNNLEKDINMHRAVAMFRLVTTDNIPSNVAKINFHYTGGSSTINAITGAGSVNSKQDETFTVQETGKTGTFEVYTFPKDDENLLKMEVTALDASGNTVASKTFDDVPITRNKITQYKGNLFTDGGEGNSGSVSFHITIDDAWAGSIEKSF